MSRIPSSAIIEAGAETGKPFIQDAPRLGNQYTEDSVLQEILQRYIPESHLDNMKDDLETFGHRVIFDLWPRSKSMDEPANLPRLRQFDAWGRRVDEIITSENWKYMKTVAAEEGLIATGYERHNAEFSRLHQFAKLYMFNPSSGLFSCPLAMTDGAAKFIETRALLQDKSPHFKDAQHATPELREAYQHLTSRDPTEFWTSGQWMTERGGGSDVGNGTRTVAKATGVEARYKLHGYKWFTSAADSEMTLTLARIEDDDQTVGTGSRGISCFFAMCRDKSGELNNLRIVRLKNKLGTKQLPTAELELHGMDALLVSSPGRGVAAIANMINITRMYNSISACSSMRRILAINRDYMHRRRAFNGLLKDNGLHITNVASMEIKFRGSMYMTFDILAMLGRIEWSQYDRDHGLDMTQVSRDKSLVRLLTPLVKLFTAKLAMDVVSEGLEGLGGQGYIEDTGIPGILRDAQVLPIWEGTTNVLSMDLLRVVQRHPEAMKVFNEVVRERAARLTQPQASKIKHAIIQALDDINHFVQKNVGKMQLLSTAARELAFSMSRVFVASVMIEHALWSGSDKDMWILRSWVFGHVDGVGTLLSPGIPRESDKFASNHCSFARDVALDRGENKEPRGYGNGPLRARL